MPSLKHADGGVQEGAGTKREPAHTGWGKLNYVRCRCGLMSARALTMTRGKGVPHGNLRVSEQELEEPFQDLLERQLFRKLVGSFTHKAIANTARRGVVGGQWAQPDIVALCIRRYLSQYAPELSLIGFELKTQKGVGIDSVHQAYAYSRFLHESYLVVAHDPSEAWSVLLAELMDHATSLGVGIIRINYESMHDDWKIESRARRYSPAPHLVDQFLRDRMPSYEQWIQERLKP